MAVLPDYLNLSLLLRISNKQQTDIEYELPDDIRKLEDFELPEGYVVQRGDLVGTSPGPAVTVTMPISSTNTFALVVTSEFSSFNVTTATGTGQMHGRMFLLSVGSDDVSRITALTVTNLAGPTGEYTFITLPT
tara:strand:- start:7554 stop:7955 length:402 start_codon:yes stop_codon:yes gene_type:complete